MNKTLPAGLALFSLIILSACGNRGTLEPPEGKTLPPAIYGEAKSPSAEDLLIPSTQAQPERSDELLRRSEKRQDDKFDLPPPG